MIRLTDDRDTSNRTIICASAKGEGGVPAGCVASLFAVYASPGIAGAACSSARRWPHHPHRPIVFEISLPHLGQASRLCPHAAHTFWSASTKRSQRGLGQGVLVVAVVSDISVACLFTLPRLYLLRPAFSLRLGPCRLLRPLPVGQFVAALATYSSGL